MRKRKSDDSHPIGVVLAHESDERVAAIAHEVLVDVFPGKRIDFHLADLDRDDRTSSVVWKVAHRGYSLALLVLTEQFLSSRLLAFTVLLASYQDEELPYPLMHSISTGVKPASLVPIQLDSIWENSIVSVGTPGDTTPSASERTELQDMIRWFYTT